MVRSAARSPFGGSNELQAMCDEIVGACEAIAPGSEVSTPIDGFDATRMVKVALDGGGRVRSVTVDPSWRTRLDGNALGAAVVKAVQDAAVGRLRAWGESVGVCGPRGRGPGPSGTEDPAVHPTATEGAGRARRSGFSGGAEPGRGVVRTR